MQKNQKGFGAVEIIMTITVIVMLAAASYAFLSHTTRKSITNDGETFSIDIGTKATTSMMSGQQFYVAKLDNYPSKIVASVYKPRVADKLKSCKYVNIDVTILDKAYPACGQKELIYIVNFQKNEKWYQATVFAEGGKTKIRSATAIKLFQSIQ